MSERGYTIDPVTCVWRSPLHSALAYSDGDAIERRLLNAVRNCSDVSVLSTELARHITDWPSEYHFSPQRHVLLRPIAISPHSRVLELGCGCGAITRYLGETGASVVAVEGSPLRAAIAAERCRDLPNVKIYCDNLADFDAESGFDLVTLIGVLEYAPIYLPEPDPVGTCLRVARERLARDGQLVLAIENQLGLKYFNGCREDHLGLTYYGVHDLYTSGQPVTFGKRELSRRLAAAGFVEQDFSYPLPDYKLPKVILSDPGTIDAELRVGDMLARLRARDHGGPDRHNFCEALAVDALVRNDLLGDMANSFLVLASPGQRSSDSGRKETWLASTYALDRDPAFCVETIFVRSEGSITVRKQLLDKDGHRPHPFLSHQPAGSAPYIAGELYLRPLQRLMARNASLEDVARWAEPWIRFLLSNVLDDDRSDCLPADWIDATPANLVRQADGGFCFFDREWHAAEPISVCWVVVRGLVNSIVGGPSSSTLAPLSFRQAIDGIHAHLGLPPLTESDYVRSASLEDTLATVVFGSVRQGAAFAKLLDQPIVWHLAPATVEQENVQLRQDLHAVLTSRSWLITKPLRHAADLISRLQPGAATNAPGARHD